MMAGASPPVWMKICWVRYSVEPGVPAETVEALRAMGHRVEVDGTGAPFGGYQAIMRLPDGVYVGATEMRKDGTVVAW